MKTLFPLLLLLALSNDGIAQYQSNYNKIWAFGYKAGLDFTSGSPVPITTGFAGTLPSEGCASVCDSFGHLLFYTKGTDIYNRNHVVMPSSPAVTSFSTFSTTQAALILPVIDSPHKYYVFSLQQGTIGDTAMCRLVYCKVDLTLASGYGDIVSTTKETPIADSLAEKMIAITGNSKNMWLMVHMKDTALFLAYEITSAGINATPVISASGRLTSPLGYAVGVLKASHNRRKIVSNSVAQSVMGNKSGAELYDFDPSTGIVSNCMVIDSEYSHYGAEYSPDNSKLYINQKVATDTMRVFQYDISLAGIAAIRASKTEIALISRVNGGDMKLGPDKKIYLTSDTFSTPGYCRYMNCITSPNLPGAACGFVYRAITMTPGTGMQYGLPNVYVTQDTSYVPPVLLPSISKKNSIDVFPNPATTELTVIATEKIIDVTITDISGQRVFNGAYADMKANMDVRFLLPGLYWVRVNNTFVRQFLKL